MTAKHCISNLFVSFTETEPIPLNLLPGQILPAYVTYIEGISNFFIQLNVPLAEKIQSEIGIYVQNSEVSMS